MNVNVWAVIEEDRHRDTDVRIYLEEDAALVYVRRRALEINRYDELLVEMTGDNLTESMKRAGWIYHATMGDDGPKLRVVHSMTHERV